MPFAQENYEKLPLAKPCKCQASCTNMPDIANMKSVASQLLTAYQGLA